MVDPKQQLEELLGDPGYSRTISLLTKEVMSKWNLSHSVAHGSVLSAIGEPAALATIYEAWVLAKSGQNPKLPALISRRRVLDLLGKDARRANHSSSILAMDELEVDTTSDVLRASADLDPRAQLEYLELIQMIRGAVTCFAGQGTVQSRQAQLLQRRMIDEIPYSELSSELACNEGALRVRVYAAMQALRKHIVWCHPELLLTNPL